MLTEMEGLRQLTDLQRRRFLREQIELKQTITRELEREDLSVLKETELKEALEMIVNNIQKIRMEGLL